MATHSLTDGGQPPAVADRRQETSARAVSAGFQCRYFLRLAAAYALLASDLGGYAESLTVLTGVRAAEDSLRRTAAKQAAELAAAAERLAGARGGAEDLATVRLQVEDLSAGLGRFQPGGNPRS